MPAREPDAGGQAGKAPRAAQPGGGYGRLPAAERRRREAERAAKLDATLRREAAMPLDEYLAYLQTPESNVVYNPKDPEDVAAYTRHHAELQQRFGAQGTARSTWAGPGSKGFSRDEEAALTAWQGDGYKKINVALRTGKAPPAGVAKQIAALDAVLERSSTGAEDTDGTTVVYRGVDLTPADYERFTSMQPGESFTDAGFVATSQDVTTAEGLLRRPENSVLMHVTIPAGSHGLEMRSDADSQYGAESETLLPRSSTFRVVAVDRTEQGFPRLHVELSTAPAGKVLSSRGRPQGAGTPEDPIDVQGDLDRALDLLAEGKHVRLNQPDEVSTLIGKLGKVVNDARAAGRTPPAIDLCQVTVAGTNLFCVGNKGHRRIDMPQLEGTALPGTTADTLPRNPKGFVEVADQFRQALEDAGVTVTTRDRPANRLRATQAELNGGIVARIAGEIEQGRTDDPIYVTRDGYIIDGHHVWAANVAVDTKDNRLGDVQMPVHEIDMDIGAAIDFARQFAKDIGVESASVSVPANRS